jgi:transposase InsO family protein
VSVICRSFQDVGPRKELSSHDPAAPPAAAHCDALHIVYTRIQGALANLDHHVGRGTIANILKRHGIEPAPERQKRTTWREFLKVHWDVLAATDFFTVEVWTCGGLTRFAVLFVIELATRRVEIAGIVSEPDRAWVLQCGRQLTDAVDGFLVGKHFLLHDRDPLFTAAFRETLAAAGVETVRLPPRSPNLNAVAERFARTIKESCLERVILIGEASLRRAIREFETQYHHERNHQGLKNQLIIQPTAHR